MTVGRMLITGMRLANSSRISLLDQSCSRFLFRECFNPRVVDSFLSRCEHLHISKRYSSTQITNIFHTTSNYLFQSHGFLNNVNFNRQMATLSNNSGSLTRYQKIKSSLSNVMSHYYYAFRLFFLDLKIAGKLIRTWLTENKLSEREKYLLKRTFIDIIRMVPVVAMILIPFAELLIPPLIKMFPKLMPNAFHEHRSFVDIPKSQLEFDLILRSAMFDECRVVHQKHVNTAEVFSFLVDEVKNKNNEAFSQKLVDYIDVISDKDLLNSLSEPKLKEMLDEVSDVTKETIQTCDPLKLFQDHLDSIYQSDMVIHSKLVTGKNLDWTSDELQTACKHRGISHLGVSDKVMRKKLFEWVDHTIDKRVPSMFMILTHFVDSMSSPDLITESVQEIPESVIDEIEISLAQSEGDVVSNEEFFEQLKDEEKALYEARQTAHETGIENEELICTEKEVAIQVDEKSGSENSNAETKPKDSTS